MTRNQVERIAKQIPGYDPWKSAGESTFDWERAARKLAFVYALLRFTEGVKAGQPFALEDWQAAVLVNLWGWYRPDGTRRYREAFVFVPRKNGKTVLAAAMIAIELFTEKEAGAQLYSAAADREQAALAYRHLAAMVQQESELSVRCSVKPSMKCIERNDDNWAMYKALSADANTKHGLSPSFLLIDELHAHPNRDLVDVLLTGTGARRQPLTVYITTADYERPSICNEKYDYAARVRDGLVDDPSFLPVIYEAQIDDDWTSEAVWHRANPNLGVSKSLDYMRRECKKAQEIPAYQNTFLRLELNVRTQQDVRAIPMDQWDACTDILHTDTNAQLEWRAERLEALRNRVCYGGLDLGSVSDLTAFALLFEGDDGVDVLPFFWCSQKRAEQRTHRDRVPYTTWGRMGFVTLTEGNETDYQQVREDINALAMQYELRSIAADRLFQGAQLCQDLIRDGLDVVAFGQGYVSLAAPTRMLLELVSKGQLHHGANPVLRWMAGNASTEADGKNAAATLKFSKKKSNEKIDGIMAACMGLGVMATATAVPQFQFEVITA